jgi:hypothetical protein
MSNSLEQGGMHKAGSICLVRPAVVSADRLSMSDAIADKRLSQLHHHPSPLQPENDVPAPLAPSHRRPSRAHPWEMLAAPLAAGRSRRGHGVAAGGGCWGGRCRRGGAKRALFFLLRGAADVGDLLRCAKRAVYLTRAA